MEPHPETVAADSSLLAVLASFAAAGYRDSFTALDDGVVRCGSCQSDLAAADLDVTARHRVDGASDPDDTLLVVGAVCPVCAHPATVVASFGPMAEARDMQIVADLVVDPDTPDPLAGDS
jgi:hypothetical protein